LISAHKLLWGEGQFLRPQHFQRQDAYHEWRLAQAMRALHPYAFGIQHLKLDPEALATGVLRVLELRALLPDGDIVDAPALDDLPADLALQAIPANVNELVYHLVVPPLKSRGSNVASLGGADDAGARYVAHGEQANDWMTGAVEAEVVAVKKSLRLLADHEPRDHLVSLPIARVRRSATSGFELDPRFMPPSMSVEASPYLLLQLRRLLGILQAKVDALYGLHREPAKNVIEFRSGDVASFWLLHTASSAFASLSHLFRHPGLHPERLFQGLLELAGSLLTFSKSFTLADLPTYDHANPGPAFAKLDQVIRELLETVISTRYFSVHLTETKPSYLAGRLDSGQINAGTSLYLGVTADVPPAELVDSVPLRFKTGAPDDVEKLVLSAMAGVRLVHAPQVPPAVPVRPGAYYFQLEPRGALYERMLAAQAISIYTPSGMKDLRLELIAINP
jgi:type VI secretion system protein ImpJ